jgi:hypothetical protein
MDQSAIYPETICEGIVGACRRVGAKAAPRNGSKPAQNCPGSNHALGAPSPRPHRYAKRCGRGFLPNDLSHVNSTHC